MQSWRLLAAQPIQNLTSEAARLSPWQPVALQAARQCARPELQQKVKTTTHIGNYAHSYTKKNRKERHQYTSLQCNTTNKQETTLISHI